MEADDIIQDLGTAATDVFEQMLKGNWVDDHGHQVHMNKAMRDLRVAVLKAVEYQKAQN